MKNLQKAFTLVELLVVIIILTILATIGFVSLSGYTQNTRDSVRLSDLSSATKQLIIYQTKNNSLPIPQDVKNVIFSDWVNTKNISAQGSFGIFQSNFVWISEIKDPSTQEYYSYWITSNGNAFQLSATLEQKRLSAFHQAYVDTPEARVVWNYIATPMVPWLIIANPITDNYILNQNLDTTYFVYDRWPNLPYELSWEDTMNIAYWEDTIQNYMDWILAYYKLDANGVIAWWSWEAVIKDKSWNGYHMRWIDYNNSEINFSEVVFQSGWVLFSNDQSQWISGRFQIQVEENILWQEFDTGFSIVNRVYHQYYTSNSQRTFSFLRYFIENGNIVYNTWFNPLRITWDKIHVVDAYHDDTNNDGIKDTTISDNDYFSEPEIYTWWYHTYVTTYDYIRKERRLYKDSQLVNIEKITDVELWMNQRNFNRTMLLLSNVANESFHGSIISSIMYNRPLPPSEVKNITQQLKYVQ